mmetsp:Transcript_12066/g.19310  ORF Transcript_12066/g.19310 Transcript_12066/m.19310 type:complete len:80 (+) Transcript_12066:473-712(+)
MTDMQCTMHVTCVCIAVSIVSMALVQNDTCNQITNDTRQMLTQHVCMHTFTTKCLPLIAFSDEQQSAHFWSRPILCHRG